MPNQAKATLSLGNRVDLSWDAAAPENDFYVSCGWGLTGATRAALVSAGDSSGTLGMSVVNDSAGYDQLLTVQLWNDAGTIKWAYYSNVLGGGTFGYITTNHTEADVFHVVQIASVLGVGLKVKIDGDDYGTILADAATPNAVRAAWGQYGGLTDGEYFVEDVKVGTTAYGSTDLFTSTFAASFAGWGTSSAISPSTPTAETDEFPAGGSGAVVATAATDVSARQATFNGTANPGGVQSNAHFEYGLTVAYGAATTEVDIGAGVVDVPVSVVVGGLLPAHTYHYRLVMNQGDSNPPSLLEATWT